jgi:hypothetical protein
MLPKSHFASVPSSKAADALDSPQSIPNNARHGLDFFVGGVRKGGMPGRVAGRSIGSGIGQPDPGEKAAEHMRVMLEDGRGIHAL